MDEFFIYNFIQSIMCGVCVVVALYHQKSISRPTPEAKINNKNEYWMDLHLFWAHTNVICFYCDSEDIAPIIWLIYGIGNFCGQISHDIFTWIGAINLSSIWQSSDEKIWWYLLVVT